MTAVDVFASVRGRSTCTCGHTPAAPVLEAFGDTSDREVARICGVSIRTVQRWRTTPAATVPIDVADRTAIALGMHLSELCPDLYRDAL